MNEDFERIYNNHLNESPYDFGWNKLGFNRSSENASDISAHMPILEYFASLVNHLTEFGSRHGCSTTAFIRGMKEGGVVHSYDINRSDNINKLVELAAQNLLRCNYNFHQEDTLRCTMEPTELLFVDTLHTYGQVLGELNRHGDKVGSYLIFHDTISQGERSLDVGGAEGINRAIDEYTKDNWRLIYEAKFNHGLRIYQRCQ